MNATTAVMPTTPGLSLSDIFTMESVVFGSFVIMSFAAVLAHRLARRTDQHAQTVSNVNFLRFQRSFFLVYFMALLGDWLQGPYVYRLYDYYGFKESEIAVLYVAGFASSVCFGTATGPMADILGRKRVAILFCVMYTFCCLTKLSSNFWMLMLGRVFGGISTSMLFSTFESWYVYEHTEHHGFPQEWIGVTFSTATFYNGLLAILAGVISNFTAESANLGPVAPFVVACFPLITAGIIITKTWPENFGNRKHKLVASCIDGFRTIINDEKIFLLGGIQTMIESCMYIFVFLWTPVLLPASPPLGMVFASFMVCIMIGSSLYSLLLSKGYQAEDCLRLCLYMIGASLCVCLFTAGPNSSRSELVITYCAFLFLELAIGMYFPAMSYTKSHVIPESHRANVMNWFRVPMNVITCAALLCLHIEFVAHDKRTMFFACLALVGMGIVMSTKFIRVYKESKATKEISDQEEQKERLLQEDVN